jgi:hypothetical protein
MSNPPALLSDAFPDAFLAAFLEASLAPASFTHHAHLHAAWLLLQRMPLEDAVGAACDALAAIARRHGAPEKFHRTVTEAYVRLIASRGPAASWDAFLAANADLAQDGRRLLARYYSDDLLHSSAARERFLAPDRDPLP